MTTKPFGAWAVVGAFLLVACGSSDENAAPSSSSGANGGASFGGAASDDQSKTCTKDADCDDQNACTTDACVRSGEFSHCTHEPIADAGACTNGGGPDSNPSGVLSPIDTACTNIGENAPSVYPPFVPLKSPDVPATCKNGFELQQAKASSTYTLTAKTPQGAGAITLDVDLATYLQPDGLTVTGVDANGKTYTLLETCRLQTWTKADPTGGKQRPPDETIRQFRVQLRAGTKQLQFSFGEVVSPMYLQVLGLCDFNVTSFASAQRWAAVP